MNRPRANDRNLHDQIVETRGFEARQHRLLRARFDLEDADGIGALQHFIRRPVIGGDAAERERRALGIHAREERECIAQEREHPQTQQVDLDESEIAEIVFVPLDDRAIAHRRPLDGCDSHERIARDHHTARMNAHVARKAVDAPADRHERIAQFSADGTGIAGIGIGAEVFRDESVEMLRPRLDGWRNRKRWIGSCACVRTFVDGAESRRMRATGARRGLVVRYGPRAALIGARIEIAPFANRFRQRTHRAVVRAERTRERLARVVVAHDRIDLCERETHRLADIANRRARAVGDDFRGHRGVFATVTVVHVLNDLLAVLVREVDVDIGDFFAFLGEKTLEE